MTLTFGYNAGLVPGIRAAWGARWIVTQDGGVDQLWDRQDAFGSQEAKGKLIAWLSGGAGKEAQETARRGLREHRLSTREGRPVILHQDREGAVVGNTRGSAGYMYVAAYRFEDLPEGLGSNGLEMVMADSYLHAFKTAWGLPPDKGDKPICGAELTDDYDWKKERPECPSCKRLMDRRGAT